MIIAIAFVVWGVLMVGLLVLLGHMDTGVCAACGSKSCEDYDCQDFEGWITL